MSSEMKDARWQLALDYVAEDGYNWDNLEYDVQEAYLYDAREHLEKSGTRELIDSLAKRFRSEGEEYDPKWDDVHHGEMIW